MFISSLALSALLIGPRPLPPPERPTIDPQSRSLGEMSAGPVELRYCVPGSGIVRKWKAERLADVPKEIRERERRLGTCKI